MAPAQPIDVVYMWVDDSWPGYIDTLNRYRADPRDTNPNRTRDNLDIIRYGLRSVATNLPDIRRIYLVSCRPQVPRWLDDTHPKIRVVHHDEIMAPSILPTFNSFSIVSHLHLLPDLSDRFLYIEDDMLVTRPDLIGAMFAPDGRPHVHLKPHKVVPLGKLDPKSASPWNLALANTDAALSRAFGPGPRNHIIHGPLLLDREICARMLADYPAEIAATRDARFRGGACIAPEVMAQHLALETGAAVRADWSLSRQVQGYVSLDNLRLWTWYQLARVKARHPMSITLNDSFEDAPNPKVEQMVRARLERWFPDPSPFERK